MKALTRRNFVKAGSFAGALMMAPGTAATLDGQAAGFTAASNGGPERRPSKGPGLQYVTALREVTGGGTKVFGIAVQYDTAIDAASLALDTFAVSVFPPSKGGGMMGGPGPGGGFGGGPGGVGPVGNPEGFPGGPGGFGGPGGGMPGSQGASAKPLQLAAVYTNAEPALRADRRSVPGAYVITELQHDADLSTPSNDGDKVSVLQTKAVRTIAGASYAGSETAVTNASRRGNDSVVRGLDAWEQNHWWWDDAHATHLEYSIRLPKSFLEPGGEAKAYPLVLAMTHSGTSYDGTCAETLTETVIASIWGMPEEQAERECVVITPRYERTTMNDYWEHTSDVENTFRLVEFLLSGRWNFGNPNKADRADKTLKIDPKRVYTTGWSMGGMTSLWLMAKHPEAFAAGLVIAGQQRPSDVVTLAHQNVLILTGALDEKATPWNEKCVPVWEKAGAKVTRPEARLDPALIFPVDDQRKLNAEVKGYLGQGGNITFLTFANVDHMGSARKFFYLRAAREWLFAQRKA